MKIAKVTGKCPACEDYAERNSTTPPKTAVMACEGACARGEVARRAANLVAHRLAADSTVRICLGGAFTKDTGQRNLVRRADRVIAIEGCFINCSSRMMQGVLPDLNPEIIRADLIYNLDLPFGIDEVPDEMFTVYAYQVADRVVQDYLNGSAAEGSCKTPACGTGPVPSSCGCQAPVPCGTSSSGCAAGPSVTPNVLSPDVVTVRRTGSGQFSAENSRGGSVVLDDGSSACSPVEALMAALGGCVNMAVIGRMQGRGKTPQSMKTVVSGIRTATPPFAYTQIHIAFSFATDLGDSDVSAILKEAVTVLCPVAVTLGRAAEVTWDFRRVAAD